MESALYTRFQNFERTLATVETTRKQTVSGFVYAVDPETGNVALLRPGPVMTLIFAEHVKVVREMTMQERHEVGNGVPTEVPGGEEEVQIGPTTRRMLTMSAEGVSHYAQRILQSPDPMDKVRLTREAMQHWQTHRTLGPVLSPPPYPARPSLPNIVATLDMPSVKEVDVPSNIYHLHGLAHVELNAIDLCMDTMLRFGHGVWGEEWVTDWITVASDEARHFSWLHDRLHHFGSFYGALPAHGAVWKGVEQSKVGRRERLVMGQLVAEARGLDAGPRLMKRLLGFGDKMSAELVATIAEEEIHHVRIGVKWFLSECEREGLDGGEEFRRIALHMRNPGAFIPPFDVERRRVAGLVPEWYLPVAEEMARVRREKREETKKRAAEGGNT